MSIALACILKNEERNIAQLLNSVKDCFDEIHLTDTGSTDNSIEIINSLKQDYPLHLHHFKWIDDFAAARNASFAPVTTDYVMWLDLDDVLSGAEGFKNFTKTTMKIADFWVATYHYASDGSGKPICSFVRERIFRTNLKLKWKYFVHEGVIPKSDFKKDVIVHYATSWNVVHKRSDEDAKQDKSRNIKLFSDRKNQLDARMKYYYGKELFETGDPLTAFGELLTASADETLEGHDRLMSVQYCCISAMQLNQFDRAIQIAHQGLQLDPCRAEFYVIIGDSYLKMNRINEAIPNFRAAASCPYQENRLVYGAIYSHADSYKHYPLNQLARIYANQGNMDLAEETVNKAMALGDNQESIAIASEIQSLKSKVGIGINISKSKNEDIVVSCHPGGFYEWDEHVYKTKGIGGSETAVVEMAYWLSRLTDRKVLVFNNRAEKRWFGNVEYLPANDLPMYFASNVPKVNINWRHNIKLTDADTYLWSHDLMCHGIERSENYKELLALSEFHKNFLINIAAVPENKIRVTRNGIDPDRFKYLDINKVDNRVIWSSSPDRGLERAMLVMDEVVREFGTAELHCYYGFDNMLKMGKKAHVESIQAMIKERPYVKFVGNVSQSELSGAMASAQVWLYPTNFLETFCITAVEALCCKVHPVVRAYGALEDTLSYESKIKMADVINSDCETKEEIDLYAQAVINSIYSRSWQRVEADKEKHSWQSVAKEWIEFMGL